MYFFFFLKPFQNFVTELGKEAKHPQDFSLWLLATFQMLRVLVFSL